MRENMCSPIQIRIYTHPTYLHSRLFTLSSLRLPIPALLWVCLFSVGSQLFPESPLPVAFHVEYAIAQSDYRELLLGGGTARQLRPSSPTEGLAYGKPRELCSPNLQLDAGGGALFEDRPVERPLLMFCSTRGLPE